MLTYRITTYTNTVNNMEYEMSLTIKSVQEEDFGVFTCKAYNPLGHAMAVQAVQGIYMI